MKVNIKGMKIKCICMKQSRVLTGGGLWQSDLSSVLIVVIMGRIITIHTYGAAGPSM